MRSMKLLLPLTLLLCQCGAHQHTSHSSPATAPQLGVINFTTSGKPEAKQQFDLGMLLLHSFEYADAAEAFQQAQKTDPSFAMAYWGEAMTYTHFLWREQDLDKGRAALQKLAPTLPERKAKANNELEKDLIQCSDLLYGKGNKTERDSTYHVFLESLYNKYPGNDEIAALYALSLINYAAIVKQPQLLERSAEISKAVMQKNPKHPGALHYIIHAYDNPEHAALALATADKYAKTAPGAGHALHMPTHTYLALGMWDKVITSNTASWNAEKQRKQRKKLDNSALAYHSYFWLMYGYLQKNERQQARNIIDSMQQLCNELPNPAARSHLLFMKTTYLAETDDFYPAVVSIEVPDKDLNIVTRARNFFAKGSYAFHLKDKDQLNGILLQLSGEILVEQSKVQENGIRICGNVNRSLATAGDIRFATVIEMELKALKAWLNNDNAETEKWLKLASGKEAEGAYAYGPPLVVKPAPELYGDWLVLQGRNKDAIRQYNLSLDAAPNKTLSVAGLQTANARQKE